VPVPGSFVTRTVAGEPVLLVRGSDGGVRAFRNRCRHRGAKICEVASGTKQQFTCPYHGWSYDLAGRLLATAADGLFPPAADAAGWGLFPVPNLRCEDGIVYGSWDS
jgi:phenylpropionate dioxygenase-like ring-hydroxylating dioxygenase large terminal subunit